MIKFLRLVDGATPPGEDFYLIACSYSRHKHPKVGRWLKKRPRFHVHYAPTSSSWLNMVERFSLYLTVNRLRRGIFRSGLEIIDALDGYVDQHNANPQPFLWTANANELLAKVIRAKSAALNLQSV